MNTLMNRWEVIGYYQNMEILRHTAALTMLIEPGFKFDISEEMLHPIVDPKIAKTMFESAARYDDDYLLKLVPHQWEILGECIDIVNEVRTDDGCEDQNIKNKYRIMGKVKFAGSFSYSSQTQAPDDQAVPADIINATPIAPIEDFIRQDRGWQYGDAYTITLKTFATAKTLRGIKPLQIGSLIRRGQLLAENQDGYTGNGVSDALLACRYLDLTFEDIHEFFEESPELLALLGWVRLPNADTE